MTQLILGIVKIVVALFIPFFIFGGVGLFSAGTSYHYYTRHAQVMDSNKRKHHHITAAATHD